MTRIPLLSALFALALTACSGETAHGSGGTPPAPETGGPAMLLVEGNDTMQYTVKQLTVKAGQQVKLVFKNIGSMPKAAMGHNLVVLKEGVTAMAFGPSVVAKGTADNGYLPDDAKKDVIAHTKLLGPGEHDTIEFMAPEKPCTLEYVCTFPGHFALMNGKITVQ